MSAPMGNQRDRYSASYRCLPASFGNTKTDNFALLKMECPLYVGEGVVLEPHPDALGENKKSSKISTNIEFGDIYVVWAIGTTLYKIGVSTNFLRRFKDLSASSPLPLQVVKYARCDNPHLLEGHLHGVFADRLFKNEWFSLDQGCIDTINGVFDRYFERPKAA